MSKKTKKSAKDPQPVVGKDVSLRELLRVPRGAVDLAVHDPAATPGFPGAKGKKDAADQTEALEPVLSDLQERLFAAGRDNPAAPRVLLILQGLDTSGKGGVIRHAIGMLDPQGCHIKAFKAPTDEEREHDYLWRIRREVPGSGMIGIFDRSQYEDVLVVRVDELVPVEVWKQRFDEINQFEKELIDDGVKVVKCFLHISKDEQKARLAERLDNPEKYWKYNPGDLDTRSKWDAYTEAYQDVLAKCNQPGAPWYIVPSDRKWYRNWAVARILLETLQEMELEWPEADFDIKQQKKLLEQS